jgi:Mg-chelatase subunit ChlD
MMFIIDHSGSMEDYWGGMSRLARAKLELIKVIRELPEETEFAIMFYETNVRIWRKSLVTATESNKLEAINFVRRLGFGDRTNTYGALRQALTFDKDLETVFLLTDGQPTIGETVEPQKILVDILGRNRFRHLNFNTIGIAVNPNTEAFLRQLATGTGGEYRRAL